MTGFTWPCASLILSKYLWFLHTSRSLANFQHHFVYAPPFLLIIVLSGYHNHSYISIHMLWHHDVHTIKGVVVDQTADSEWFPCGCSSQREHSVRFALHFIVILEVASEQCDNNWVSIGALEYWAYPVIGTVWCGAQWIHHLHEWIAHRQHQVLGIFCFKLALSDMTKASNHSVINTKFTHANTKN